jgi:hypothetical protein
MNMSQSYKKSCMYCNKTIEMNDNASGKWLPYNMNGTQHDCRNQTQQTGTKKEEPIVAVNQKKLGPLTMEELDTRLKRVESFLFLAGKK